MMVVLLAALVLLVVADGIITQVLVGHGFAREGNPFLKVIIGERGFIALKAAGSLLCAFILWDIYRRYPRLAFVVASLATAGYGLIVVWNLGIWAVAH